MKHDPYSTDRDVPGRMDPQESSVCDSSSRTVSGAHLNEIRDRLLLEPRARREAVIAWATETHSFLSGTRGIARWTDQHKETVQGIAGPTGALSRFRFLYTSTRGSSSVTEEEREDMRLRFNSLTGRSWSPLGPSGYRQYSAQYFTKTPMPSTPWTLSVLEEGKIQRGNGRILAGIGEGLMEDLVVASEEIGELTDWGSAGSQTHRLLTLLDPANDCWTEERCGKAAWHLAVLFACQDILVTSKDLQTLLGVKERQVRNLLAQWTKEYLVIEEKVGRVKVYTLSFFSVFSPEGRMYDGHLGDKTKLYRAMGRDQRERDTAARRGTPEGIIAWRAANPRTRQAFLDDLPEDADQVWRELVERGDEMELYDQLVTQAKEAGPVPSTPAPLDERPAQESLGRPSARTAEFMTQPEGVRQEQLAAMRRRVTGIWV